MARAKTMESTGDSTREKIEQILAGAMQEFLAQGYAGTSMDRVAATAGVSKATVYSYFQDKEGLFSALIEKMAQEKFEILFNTVSLQDDPKKVLRHLANKALNQIATDRNYVNFMRVIIGESGRFPNLAKIFIRNLAKPGLDKLTQYLTAHPELNLPDPEATARICIGALVNYVQTQEILHGQEIMPMESDRLIDSLAHLLLRGADC